MPTLSTDELKAAIAAGEIHAVSIDTVVFDAKGKTFHHPVLRRLDQFKQSDVEVVIADVIAHEMKAHLREAATETQRALKEAQQAFKEALRAHNKRWRLEESDEEGADLLIGADSAAFAESEFSEFLNNVGGKVLGVIEEPRSAQRIVDLYFSEEPPFGASKRRKSEFPDAYALLTLEAYAAEAGKLLLCVSADKGWAEFAAGSDHLVCVAAIEDALGLFNVANQHLADAALQRWLTLDAEERVEVVEAAFEYCLDDLDFDISAYTEVPCEAEPTSAVLQSLDTDFIGDPHVIDVQSDAVTFTVGVEARVCFEASFDFYVRDWVDKDYVDLGSRVVYVERPVPFELTIKAARSLERGPVFREVDVTRAWIHVDFGHVETLPGEDPTHEKY